MDKRKLNGTVDESSVKQIHKSIAIILCEKTGVQPLAESGLMAG